MSDCTSGLAELLDSDLLQAGWVPGNPGEPNDIRAAYFQLACESLRKSLLKKYIGGIDVEGRRKADDAALVLFLSNNEDCRSMSFSPAEGDYAPEEIRAVLGEMENVLYSVFHPENGRGILLSLGAILSQGDQGPGASVGCHNNDFYTKMFQGSLAATHSELHEYYRAYVSYFGSWDAAEKSRRLRFSDRVVPGSKLFFALKNAEISRVACTEPPLNMFFQKGIQAVLEGALKSVFGIDLRGDKERNILSQPEKNRLLAKIGSIDQSFGTIDLSSASDRISCRFVERYIPETSARWLWKTRSPFTTLPCGELQELYMISSMGNAFTFPLETIIFASVVMASYRYLGIKAEYPRGSSLGNFAVFGDDIIVKTEAYSLVTQVLSTIGHRVNHDKSFKEGFFRESCGSDWLRGHNVRGVYLKSLETDADCFSAINRLNIWSARHGIPLQGTISYLRSRCRNVLYVPMSEQDTGGIRAPLFYVREVFSRELRSREAQRSNPALSRFLHGFSGKSFGVGGSSLQYTCLHPESARVSLADIESLAAFVSGDERVLGYNLPELKRILRDYPTAQKAGDRSLSGRNGKLDLRATPFRVFTARLRRALKRRFGLEGNVFTLVDYLEKFEVNNEGVLLSALAGKLRDTSLVVKEFKTRYVRRDRTSPCWDWIHPELATGELAQDLHLLCYVNLGEVDITPEV